ncbi:MAG: hypothetical protein OER43_18940, partial [Gammaproteobacteria bacterium]|nr:hypothetical protein [Gammaproteobacteria bacterium]
MFEISLWRTMTTRPVKACRGRVASAAWPIADMPEQGTGRLIQIKLAQIVAFRRPGSTPRL